MNARVLRFAYRLAALLAFLPACGAAQLPTQQQVQDVRAAAAVGTCVIRAQAFYGNPAKLSTEQKVQFAVDLLECVPVSAAPADAGAP